MRCSFLLKSTPSCRGYWFGDYREKQEKNTITFAVFRLRWNGYWF
nr:MAG TPA: hypothetical protein [Caudoviricetes sp.]